MAYTTIKKPSDYFNTKLYAGNSGTQSITGVGFQPDFLWIKRRTNAGDHNLVDVIRTSDKTLMSNSIDAEYSNSTITSFDSDGFSLSGSDGALNASSSDYASWNWKANGAGSSNTDGSITSTVSANTTSGFSIVSYTGTGANATVGHGIGSAPKMIIIKDRDSTQSWSIYNKNIGYGNFLNLDNSNASASSTTRFTADPSSSVFSIGTNGSGNGSGNNFIAYCFSEVKGFSKFGSYTGNGNADGTFVYTGFKPAFLILKNTSSTGNWVMYDDKRSAVPDANINNRIVNANSSTDYEFASGSRTIDTLSNGFKIRGTASDTNTSGNSYIYMAFADEPLVGDNPCTAR